MKVYLPRDDERRVCAEKVEKDFYIGLRNSNLAIDDIKFCCEKMREHIVSLKNWIFYNISDNSFYIPHNKNFLISRQEKLMLQNGGDSSLYNHCVRSQKILFCPWCGHNIGDEL